MRNSCSNQSSCEHFCLFRENNHDICQCKPGYTLGEDNSTCKDIDECVNSSCVNGSCVNRNGSFACSCRNGSKLLPNGLVCKTCDSWTYGANCSGVCACHRDNTVGCDPLNGTCQCSSGWSGPNYTQDVNECNGTNSCSIGLACVNFPGYYICDCNVGFITALRISPVIRKKPALKKTNHSSDNGLITHQTMGKSLIRQWTNHSSDNGQITHQTMAKSLIRQWTNHSSDNGQINHQTMDKSLIRQYQITQQTMDESLIRQ
ncbi:hypothetical protein Btru_069946 [Bulinus truncatus]|nr:hypothetical protein Btru_069946 [Bulinus truncatus]